jgi:hypothetical protein
MSAPLRSSSSCAIRREGRGTSREPSSVLADICTWKKVLASLSLRDAPLLLEFTTATVIVWRFLPHGETCTNTRPPGTAPSPWSTGPWSVRLSVSSCSDRFQCATLPSSLRTGVYVPQPIRTSMVGERPSVSTENERPAEDGFEVATRGT